MQTDITIIDDHLKDGLQRRGHELAARGRRRQRFLVVGFMLACLVAGFSAGLFGIGLGSSYSFIWTVYCAIFAIYVIGISICLVPIRQATNALNAGLTERAAVLTRRAIELNALFFPVSFITFGYSIDAKFRLLMAESRFVEVEALTYLLFAAYQKFRRFHFDNRIEVFLQNYRAIALLGQLRYEEARGVFGHCLESTKKPALKRVLLNNIGHCQLELGQPELALPTLQEAIGLQKARSRADDMINSHLQYNLAKCLIKLNNLREAEDAANRALALGQATRSTVYVTGHCYVVIGEVKMAQGHFDEAEQHMRSGLETMRSRFAENNPAVIKVTRMLAALLSKMGRDREADELRHTAEMAEVSLEHQCNVTFRCCLELSMMGPWHLWQ